MKTYYVYEIDYPEEGCTEIDADSPEAAKLEYHRQTIGLDDPDRPLLGVVDVKAGTLTALSGKTPRTILGTVTTKIAARIADIEQRIESLEQPPQLE